VWIARLDGTHPRLLVRGGVFGVLSPDGRWVAYNRCLASLTRCRTGNAPFALFLVASSGGKTRMLARSTSYPSWSPRSDRIVALRKNRLVSLDLDSNPRVLEQSPGTACWSFSPDGKWVVYAKARQHTRCGSDLFIVRASGNRKRHLTGGRDIFPHLGKTLDRIFALPKVVRVRATDLADPTGRKRTDTGEWTAAAPLRATRLLRARPDRVGT
jgi:WD40-like Beta Propeller Repeat